MTRKFSALTARLPALEFALVSLIWGSTWLVIKGQLGVVPAPWSVAYRFSLACTLMAAFTIATGRWVPLRRRGHAFAAIAGTAQFVLNFNLVYASERHVTSGLIALVFALLVVPNALLSRIVLKTPISLRFLIGSGIGIAGLALVVADDRHDPAAWGTTLDGLLLAGAAVLCASIGNVMQASSFARSLAPFPTLTWMMFYGALGDITFAAITSGAPVFDFRPEYAAGLTYLALAASAVAFTVYYRLIRRIGPGPAAYSSVVVPVVAMTLSTLFEGYRWSITSAVGASLALAGLVVALGSRKKRPVLPATAL
ncbi:MAG: DMT family transporter [Janthinobacterium lividum]